MASSFAQKKRNRHVSPHSTHHHSHSSGVSMPKDILFTHDIPHNISVYGSRRTVHITYTNELATIDAWCSSAALSACQVFGLDCEHPPNFRAGVATEQITVLQLAVDDRVLVIQLNAILCREKTGPPERNHANLSEPLVDLFRRRPGLTFAGMGVAHDVAEVAELLAIGTRVPTIDLKAMAVARDHSMPGGLGALAEALLGVEKWKSKKLALSRWGDFPLEPRRVVYAAMDAWASWALHAHLLDVAVPARGLLDFPTSTSAPTSACEGLS